MQARYYEKLSESKVKCTLCPHSCIISPDNKGICKVRTNIQGVLYADTYGSLSAVNIDPVEKKPLYHFCPGSEILSIGTLGCNFRCACCQNYEISQSGKAGFPRLQIISVKDIARMAVSQFNNIGIAYTYNEPFVWFEYMFDIACEIKSVHKQNVIVSNGYINEEPLQAILPFIDAFNIDLKAYDEEVYLKFAGGVRNIVFRNLELIAKSGKHLELTLLVVPGINDNREQFENLVKWTADNLGKDVPFHISRYFPRYKMKSPATSISVLEDFALCAGKHLNYVYVGNALLEDYQNTVCPLCGSLVIKREGYNIRVTALDSHGCCKSCGNSIVVVRV